MKQFVLTTMIALALSVTAAIGEAATTTQTIVFFRHGEKPSGGYGQLTCQGFNRSIALTDVLVSRFGKPTYLFATNPLPKMTDSAGTFFYVRPLATIEPTAIRLGMAVNARYGYADVVGLTGALTQASFSGSTTFVAWEHANLVKTVEAILRKYKATVTVPPWTAGDYDSLYIVKLTNSNGYITATFRKDSQGLNNQPIGCP